MLAPSEVKTILEAALLAAPEPLPIAELRKMFDEEIGADTLRRLLEELREDWKEGGVELAATASGWRFQTRASYQKYLERIHPERTPRYSRAVLETLAIIAYRQPVTRGDIEEVRGVAVSPPTLNALMERGWVEIVGRRETPGRPAIFATTRKFLDDLNLRSLEELPPLEDLQSALEPATASLLELEAASSPLQEVSQEEESPEEKSSKENSTDEPQTPESSEQAH